MELTKSNIKKTLENINISGSAENIVSSGILKNIQVFGDQVDIDLILSNPTLQARKKLEVDIMKIIHADIYEKAKININVKIEKVDSKISSQSKKISGVDSIIAVSSAKGGVGKSTLTINLAATLAKKGCKVGILDADIYGPSIPEMFDVSGQKPLAVDVDGKSKMKPIENYGVKILSIGFFTKIDQAVIWRGPMASKALNQMIFDADWGILDFLLVDLPPGTGDIHLSIMQSLPISGAVVISTPQKIALNDARKGVSMFKKENINVPVLGIIENMAYFIPNELPENKYYLFGKEGARNLSTDLNIPFLGEVPIIQSVREAADFGRPAAMQENTISEDIFKNVSKNMLSQLLIRNKELPETEIVKITTMSGCISQK